MKTFFPFPSIGQFANSIRHVKHKTRVSGLDESGVIVYSNNILPKITYVGTVKLHGTNAAWVYDAVSKYFSFQSRSRILTLEQDNGGFMFFMLGKKQKLEALSETIIFESLWLRGEAPRKVVVFGEWCGGNIQNGTALNGLEKMFIIFGIQLVYEDNKDGSDNIVWANLQDFKFLRSTENGIYNILNFPTFELEVDFECPEISQNTLVKLVNRVENECPVGLTFGKSGIGEGICWVPKDPLLMGDSGYWFKSKGEKHSVSKVKTISAIDIETIETVREYVEMFVTENRMKQMMDKMVRELLEPFDMKNMGIFIRLVYTDCIKESQAEIVDNQIDVKKLGRPIADKARVWFVNTFNSL